ncbi:hypothetical protein PTXU04_00067 [Escherichia phage PTXU04]|uniref:Uncharacterized protein n=1 Tax=Escherichia phage PTXU04 TaxID=2508206 RepID=A0A482MRQ3_9CAUD|nr:hypothetical protein HOV50_gp67 [Escherichia phage PTXU04]QBQ76681.1 hypothetical protein PTXU04_00067 [Escherichia phage PTXU04]
MIDFMKLLELVYIDGFRCEISSDGDRIMFVWRGYDDVLGQTYGISRVVSKMMLEHVNDPEGVIRCMVDCARKGLEKMQ